MIEQKQLKEIKKYLDESENPLFFFDDDCDGLCSFLLFRRYLGRGEGVAVRGYPFLDVKVGRMDYLKKVNDIRPDKIFVLDKPIVEQDFIDKINVPIIWIDHHPPVKRKGIHYYNPKLKNKKDKNCTTYWCYKVVEKHIQRDLWIAGLGCIADWTIPDFLDELVEKYPDLFGNYRKASDILFMSGFGKLCRMYSFLLKGPVKDVNESIDDLSKINDPYELLEKKSSVAKKLLEKAEKIEKEYNGLLEDALKVVRENPEEKLLDYIYIAKKFSLTADLSNELIYKFPDKVIIVGRDNEGLVKMSLRSTKVNVPDLINKALEGIRDKKNYGGGHEHAGGATVEKRNFDKFISVLKREIEK